jgi:hypothetical protein
MVCAIKAQMLNIDFFLKLALPLREFYCLVFSSGIPGNNQFRFKAASQSYSI